ncbi:glycosyltransferase family 39 protein [Phreatobacter stygius]|uniref:Glycosyltransferase family 39 protein n=1 Tax=Phreatobacter stygius TaxID=1940610 RepID=A0A4D7B429_9HYPH|nr:glycosyltransferase family 39 protein [Phreatobacter stygius]QCI67671.1 glycosyltransferase family 39 protein [Phreatobacter stygius]
MVDAPAAADRLPLSDRGRRVDRRIGREAGRLIPHPRQSQGNPVVNLMLRALTDRSSAKWRDFMRFRDRPTAATSASDVRGGGTHGPAPRVGGPWLVRHGVSLFWGLVTLHCLVAFLAPTFGFLTPPRDTVEGFLWGRSLQWGYSKHPPLQAWILGLSEQMAPNAPWLAYLYAQLCVAVTLWAVLKLAIEILGEARGVLAAILTLAGVHYYGPAMATFTPDTLSAPLWALTGLWWWRAVMHRRPLAWFALAVTVAASVYAKYIGLLLVGVLGGLTLAMPEGRKELRRKEFWLALTFGIGLVSPHLWWMADTGFSSLSHAFSHGTKAESMAMRLWFCGKFLGAQIVEHAGIFLLVGICLGLGNWRPRAEIVVEGDDVPERERFVILLMAFAPITIAVLTNFAVGGEFRQGRGTALFAFSGIAAIGLAGPLLRLGRLRLGAALIVAILIGLPLANAGHHLVRLGMGAAHVPTLYPAVQLADALQNRWRARTSMPLRIVIGDRWHAGNIAFYAADQPLLLFDGNPVISPGLDADAVSRNGALVVWNEADPEALDRLRRVIPGLEAEGVASARGPFGLGRTTDLAYRIILPGKDPSVEALALRPEFDPSSRQLP